MASFACNSSPCSLVVVSGAHADSSCGSKEEHCRRHPIFRLAPNGNITLIQWPNSGCGQHTGGSLGKHVFIVPPSNRADKQAGGSSATCSFRTLACSSTSVCETQVRHRYTPAPPPRHGHSERWHGSRVRSAISPKISDLCLYVLLQSLRRGRATLPSFADGVWCFWCWRWLGLGGRLPARCQRGKLSACEGLSDYS